MQSNHSYFFSNCSGAKHCADHGIHLNLSLKKSPEKSDKTGILVRLKLFLK
jgi:hypothetical protein